MKKLSFLAIATVVLLSAATARAGDEAAVTAEISDSPAKEADFGSIKGDDGGLKGDDGAFNCVVAPCDKGGGTDIMGIKDAPPTSGGGSGPSGPESTHYGPSSGG